MIDIVVANENLQRYLSFHVSVRHLQNLRRRQHKRRIACTFHRYRKAVLGSAETIAFSIEARFVKR